MTGLFTGEATRLPAQDLGRARRWYAEMLNLIPVEERPGGLRYRIGDGEFSVFTSTGRSPSTFTQLAITVDDIHAMAAQLRDRGVELLSYDRPWAGNRAAVGRGEASSGLRFDALDD